MKKIIKVTVAAAMMVLMITACGGGGDGASPNSPPISEFGEISVCRGSLPTTVPATVMCGATVEKDFFDEHFRWITSIKTSIKGNEYEFGFARVSSINGGVEVVDYVYQPSQVQYLPSQIVGSFSADKVQSPSGAWVRFQFEWRQGVMLGPVIPSEEGNEYPVILKSPDDPLFELSIHIKNILEADIAELKYTDVGFNSVYLNGVNGTYPAGSKAYSADYVLMESANISFSNMFGDAATYASLQAFKDSYVSAWYCLHLSGRSYGIRFDKGANQATMVESDLAAVECTPKTGAVLVQVDLLEQTFNGVNFLVLSGQNLPVPLFMSLGTLTDDDYSVLLSVVDNVVTTGIRIPAGTTFKYRPGFGAYLNRIAIDAMLMSVGRPQVP